MGFFRNLWDEALAGSTSDSGVGKLRRYNSLLSRSGNPPTGDSTPVSRSITILRTNSLSGSSASGSTPSSPTGSSSAGSATSPGGDFKKLTRRKSTADAHRREPKSPTGYDWIVLTSLDR
ncbi:putative dormancy/auxin associated protein [Helianthus annuus]|uniref:Dormancy/auxin associated protein n=1 Tax=Helianthus annuus TaxID=4232 RepID=A0A9K3J3S6_HELAN|nr:dormancy-associated protein homolog 4 [Helianthus annuus]KAF5807887.1 putative dormancy/auxin associated protein [Helianthus annuus]KAJ0579184.1 putative dormancy/auxin associated protein [Helianthus annuus]KAJ0595086.1 putative dormancy/auxin associated protein [Helianthus annuus]KAJ0929255.1 putative dormancy/auxin associated protein [Helianthus annuus]